MSEPLAEHLSQFTPDASGLNRDALLFAAGRASARPNRRWQALAVVLAIAQLLTLVCLWPRSAVREPLPAPPRMAEPSPAVDPLDLPPFSAEETTPAGMLQVLTEQPDAPSDKPLVPAEPPLHAFGAPPGTIIN
jgi:hypothetical protein